MELPSRKRSRLTCRQCGQSLSYSAFRRHQEIPNLYCQTHKVDNDSDNSDSTFDLSEASHTHSADVDNMYQNIDVDSELDGSSESDTKSELDSAPEIWDEDDNPDVSDGDDEHNNLMYVISVFLAAFRSFTVSQTEQ